MPFPSLNLNKALATSVKKFFAVLFGTANKPSFRRTFTLGIFYAILYSTIMGKFLVAGKKMIA